MHTKSTVKYICEHYLPSGNRHYYKQELLTMGSWNNIESLYWSRPRPITERTYNKANKNGYKCILKEIKSQSAEIIPFERMINHDRKRKTNHKGSRAVTARVRYLLR